MALADEATRFKPGQSGNPRGRPRGSRHRLSELALKALCADFEAGGAEAIERCRREPDVYVRVVASLLPKQTVEKVNPLDELSVEELDQLVAHIEWLEENKNRAAQGLPLLLEPRPPEQPSEEQVRQRLT
jgi:Family of unknown function (DUF5681)